MWLLLPHARSATDPANRDVPAEVPCPATHLAVVRRPASTEAENHVHRRHLLKPVVAHDRAILELLAQEDDPLVVGRDVQRVLLLDFMLDIVDRVVGMHVVESDRLA